MIAGEATREFVSPKCKGSEFVNHARLQVSISHSHGIHTPTIPQGIWKIAARVNPKPSPNRLNTTACRHQSYNLRNNVLISILGNDVPGTFSLCMTDPLAISAHLPSARLVRVVARPTGCTAVIKHLTLRWAVGPCHRYCLLCAVLILALPQLPWGSQATGYSASRLLSRARMRTSRRGLRNVGSRRICG